MRAEPLEERRKRLSKLLSRKTKAMRDGIQISEAITGDGGRIFRHACGLDLEGIVSKHIGSRSEWPDTGLAEDQEPLLSAVAAMACGSDDKVQGPASRKPHR